MFRNVVWTACLALCWVGVGRAEAEDAQLAPSAPITIQGRVLDADGRPIPKAKASLEILPSQTARLVELLPKGAPLEPLQRTPVDGQGHFHLTAPGHGLYAVRVEGPGYLPVEYVLEPLTHNVFLPAVHLTSDEGIAVLVETADGAPAEGARIVARWREGGPWTLDHIRSPAWGPATRRVQVRSDGAAILPYVTGEELRIHVTLAEHALWTGLVDTEDTSVKVKLESPPGSRPLTFSAGGEPLRSMLLVRSGLPLALADDAGRALLPVPERPSYIDLWTVDGRREAVIWKPDTRNFSVDANRWRSGRIVDGVTGRPVPGALIWSPRDRHAVRADADGRFQWPTQRPAGNLRAAAPGYLPARVNDADGGSKSIDLSLQPALGIAGRVVTESGQPVAGASVELRKAFPRGVIFSTGGPREAVTLADGSFRFEGLESEQPFEVWARHDGWVPTYVVVTTSVEEGETTRPKPVELVLKRGELLGGRVVDAAYRPIGGVQVDIFSQPAEGSLTTAIDEDGRSASPTVTDGEGRFRLETVPAGQHMLLLTAPGWAPRILPRYIVTSPPQDVGDLVLEPGQPISLDLVDSNGRAVSGAEVTVRWGLEQASSLARRSEVQSRVTTRRDSSDHQGRLLMDDLPPGRVAVNVTHPNFLPLERNVTLPSEPVVMTLVPALKLSGRVVDADDQGLAGLDVLAVTQARSLGSSPMARDLNEPAVQVEAKTDNDGLFELQGVKPGTVKLTVRRSAFVMAEKELSLPPDVEPEPLLIVIDPGIDFQGTVLDARGKAVADVLVFMAYRDDPTFRLGLTTDAEGQFWVRRAPRGVANLFVNGSNGERARAQVQVEPGMDPVVLTVETERSLQGQVVDEEGRGVAEAHLHFSIPQFSYRPPTDAEGRFSIPVKGAMEVSLMATRPDMGWAVREIEVPESGALEPVELVLPRGVHIVGNVLGVSEGEMRRLKTHGVHKLPVQGMGAVRREGRVEPDGSFTIQGLMPGRVSVYAAVEGSLRRVREEVKIPPGVDEVRVDLDLGEQGLTLSGQVFHNGEPAHTALVVPGHVETDAEGRFRLEGIEAGPVQLVLIGPWGQHIHSLEMQGDRDIEIHIESYDLAGTVVDGAGQPLSEVTVECRLESDWNFSCDHATDAAGRFDLRELPPGRYQLFFYKEGYGRGQLEISLQEDASDLVITLQPGAALSFVVQSWDGVPVEYLAVDFIGLEGQPPMFKEAFGQKDGVIQIEDLPRGKWQAFMTRRGSRVVSLTVNAPGGPFPVVFEPGGEIGFHFPGIEGSTQGKLEMFDASGNAFTPADIGQELAHWPVRRQRAYTPGLASGTWTYRVNLDDGSTFEGTVLVSPGQKTELVLE